MDDEGIEAAHRIDLSKDGEREAHRYIERRHGKRCN